MKHSPELLVYKASAGSGKTFTLAVEYIKLLIQNPRAYRNILAVTFTNKATTEMKERILSQLYGIWIKDKDSDPYLQKITEELEMPQEDIRTAAGTALHYMIHDYSRFRVETIDSFFQSVMRNLARELELGANLNIELNNMEVLSDAVDSMIEKLDRQSPVLYWLLEYIEERIADDKRWNVSGEIKNFGRNIFDEGYIEKGNGLREKLRDKDCIKNYRETLQAILEEVQEQMKGFADQFFGILDTNGVKVEDLKNGSRGIASYFNKLQSGKLDDSVRNVTVEKCLDCPDEWVKKTSPIRNAILGLAEKELIPLLNESEKYRSRNNMLANSCQLSLRHVNNIRLLANIDEEVRELNHENNRFLLSDTNALLHNLVKEGDSSFVFEKIGTTIRNVMIDEFQDTSRMQWDNFRLLLLEGLSQGADSLIVGDVKQSIYRWRNGDWGILKRIENKHRSLSRQSKDTDHQSPECRKHHSLQQRSVYSRLRGVEQHLQGRTKKGMQGTEGSLQRRVSGNIQRSRKRVCQSGISIGYGRHDLYGKHPAPPRRRSGAACGTGRATERYCHPGAQEQKHSFNSRLLRQEHLLQNRIR